MPMESVGATGQVFRSGGLSDAQSSPPLAARTAPSPARRRAELNGAILETSLTVSISAGNQPLQLLFRSALEQLNEILRPEFGEAAIENAVSQDNTPEGTAGRIVTLATGFFASFAAQRPDADPAQLRRDFLELIGRGIDRGFAEAREILGGLKVLEGDVATSIDKTYALVRQGLEAFAAAPAEAL